MYTQLQLRDSARPPVTLSTNTAPTATAPRFRLANFRIRYVALGGPAVTGSFRR